MSIRLRRREFIAALGGSAVAWPLAARAQQGDRVRRIGVLMPFEENHPEGKLRYAAFAQALADLGWTEGRNVRLDLRWGGDDNNRIGQRAGLGRLAARHHRDKLDRCPLAGDDAPVWPLVARAHQAAMPVMG